ncbi:MAG: SpoVG family protein [Candidatus Omnitrophica bacterium]|nr:SpoVG family protein [Candidatus Omnitrophota bacterium]HOX54037.1 SpoVG family protein [Candidatus Omnitrophota bacterium]
MSNGLNFKIGRMYKLETDGPVKAFADILVNDELLIKGLRIIEGKKGLFVSMPKDQGKDKRWYDTVSLVSKEIQQEISSIVLEAYKNE